MSAATLVTDVEVRACLFDDALCHHLCKSSFLRYRSRHFTYKYRPHAPRQPPFSRPRFLPQTSLSCTSHFPDLTSHTPSVLYLSSRAPSLAHSMDQPPQHLLPLTEQEKYARLPHKERWEALKPIIVQLYIGKFSNGGKSTKLEDVVAFMKTHYSFHAAYVGPVQPVFHCSNYAAISGR